ncbi:Dyp-type peroxidase [Frankia nepalensis]|uniref:Dyp-type peroxidase n=1 Tax=Frankia nepalensis TaxID=1836974 RepID=A0A937RP36_9ACTN|nr:Dyp-type peroxidase [Frankia nepalensis]MBL7497846.1 Dyp-type peroxidase [Frankia nepalensis]MBL7509669.1 Dyp-type peroxidase [Frankia nepalensis]MBL7630834.1 Dyp-type peroxidase [Frankia nepalensis]
MTQPGIFALGTPEHSYLELDLVDGASAVDLVKAVAGLAGPLSTGGGVNLVAGFRPELWARIRPDGLPAGVTGFNEPIVGVDGFQMPATQRDAFVWIAGPNRTAVYTNALEVVGALVGVATVATELGGWVYAHDRDLTGFIDGTENPSLLDAAAVAVVGDGPGAGGSVLLFQRWSHDSLAFESLSVPEQEKVIGRTKLDSVELGEDVMPATSHVSRTVVEEDGEELEIFRRNTAYGTVTDHGTVFVGFAAQQRVLDLMLRRMAGATEDGLRDALTRYTTPVSGAYYFIPSVAALAGFAPEDAD